MGEKLTMSLLKHKYAVCRFHNSETVPGWAFQGEFFSITKTAEELSIVCLQEKVPEGVRYEADWRILKIEGPLDFSLIGVLSKISSSLAQNAISIFAVSTYDTDYILVKDKNIDSAVEVLQNEGYVIRN